MIIPSRFMCFGHFVDVIFDSELMKKNGLMGYTAFEENAIYLQPNVPGMKVSDSQVLETYLHEACHYILMSLEKEDLNSDEEFVSLYSRLQHQIISTSEYDYFALEKEISEILVNCENDELRKNELINLFKRYI